jgi:hypothetical protein
MPSVNLCSIDQRSRRRSRNVASPTPRCTDLFIELTGADAKTYGRDRLTKELAPRRFALLPLVLEGKLIGCLYFDCTMETIDASPTARQLLSDLRDQLVAALAWHRANAAVAER